ncbi:EamA family transporter, partial [Turicimonas muris]
MASNKVALGISLALGAAVSWGAMGIAAQYLLHYCRFEAIDLVSIRLVSAGILLLLIYRILGGTDVMSPFSSRWAFTQVAIAGVTILGSQLTFMLSIKA